jgi:hypothetical protein
MADHDPTGSDVITIQLDRTISISLTKHHLVEEPASIFPDDAPQTKMAPRVHRGAIVSKEGSDY